MKKIIAFLILFPVLILLLPILFVGWIIVWSIYTAFPMTKGSRGGTLPRVG